MASRNGGDNTKVFEENGKHLLADRGLENGSVTMLISRAFWFAVGLYAGTYTAQNYEVRNIVSEFIR